MIRAGRRAFWNREERRIPAFWRILIQMMCRFLLMFILMQMLRRSAIALDWITPDKGLPYVVKSWRPDVPWIPALKQAGLATAAVVSSALACLVLDRRRFADLGLSLCKMMWWLDLLFGLVAGVASIGTILWIGISAGWIVVTGRAVTANTVHALSLWVLWSLVTCLFKGVEEELADGHGYMMRNAAEGFRTRRVSARSATVAAYVLTSVFFGLAHYSPEHPVWFFVANLAVVGALFGLGYMLTGDLGMAIGLHAGWNFMQLNCAHPGAETGPVAALLTVRYQGPEVWTGVMAGPWRLESGILTLVACAVGVALCLLWVRLSRGKLEIAAERFEYHPIPRRADAVSPTEQQVRLPFD